MAVRTRIAPSPTGDYHVGHLRTLLYNYALAKKDSGQFLLRIEDTDQSRLVPGAAEGILEVIKLYGFNWDEYYVQSERLEIYKKHAVGLVETGYAYYCFCSEERLQQMREDQKAKGIPPKYDKHCLNLSKEEAATKVSNGEKFVIRLNVPKDEVVEFNDAVYGLLTFNSGEIDDSVLIKSDGFPTYHMAVVVDDHLMNVSHILRGNDWLPSAPKHVLLYKYLGWDIPVHAHLPNLKEKDGSKKLSKRFGAVSAYDFLSQGYLQEAVLNLLMFAGWNPGTDKEIYSLDEFINDFSLDKVHKTDLVVFDRDKLLWLNGHYIRSLSPDDLWVRIKDWAERFEINLGVANVSEEKIVKVLSLLQERLKLLGEFPIHSAYFFSDPTVGRDLLVSFAADKTKEILENYLSLYEPLDTWEKDHLDGISHNLLTSQGYKAKEAFMTLRVAVSGVTATPPLFDMLEVLGKDTVIKRINGALKLL
jgi:glutamyl-tRNA synthetase